ncbi:MAG: FAD:protein FMN transferase [Eubacteriales bacterium]
MQNTITRPQLYTIIVCLLFLSVGIFITQLQPSEPISKTDLVLNTVATITIYDSNDTTLLDECFALCNAYEDIYSATNSTSELYQLNQTFQTSVDTPIPVSVELLDLIEISLDYALLSNGSFDPTIGVISTMWDFTGESPIPPTRESVEALLPLVDYTALTLGEDTITNHTVGMQLDLGGIAKGYIADRIADYLVSCGVTSAYVNLGGNIVCIGNKGNGQDFQVGVQLPFADSLESAITLSIQDASVVTCGIYERSYTYEGIFYHHILNPSTGFPYENELLSVTIVSPDSVDGDALSTTCYALGPLEGISLLDSITDTYGIFLLADGTTLYSIGAEVMVE